MADRMPSGKKIFATSDFSMTEDEKDVLKVERDLKVQEEINSATIHKEKALKEVNEFNDSLSFITKEAQNLKILGNKVLVRLYKHNPYRHGFYEPIMIRVPSRNESGRVVTEQAALQIVPRGIICAISDTASENFKNTYRVGDVVDIVNGIMAEDYMCFMDKTVKPSLSTFDYYFLFNENHIEKGFKDNLGVKPTFE